MECYQPSIEFLHIWIDHPHAASEEKGAIRRQIAYLEARIEKDFLASNPEEGYMSPSATESECESPLKKRADRSPSGEPPSPKKFHLRGGAGSPVKPRWQIHDHEHAIDCNANPDVSKLPGALRRREHDPVVPLADDNSGSANALYQTTEETVEFFKTGFGYSPDLESKPLVVGNPKSTMQ